MQHYINYFKTICKGYMAFLFCPSIFFFLRHFDEKSLIIHILCFIFSINIVVSVYMYHNAFNLFVLFGFYIVFNISVISQLCLDVAGSSMFIFRVLPHY